MIHQSETCVWWCTSIQRWNWHRIVCDAHLAWQWPFLLPLRLEKLFTNWPLACSSLDLGPAKTQVIFLVGFCLWMRSDRSISKRESSLINAMVERWVFNWISQKEHNTIDLTQEHDLQEHFLVKLLATVHLTMIIFFAFSNNITCINGNMFGMF